MEINEIKESIENFLEEYFKNKGSYNKIVYESAGYSLNVGGKRVRPILMCLAYLIYKDTYQDIIEMAASIEMIHTYSLIHDDLPAMDNDDLRRGKPTNHKVYGEAVAILAGDALLNEAHTLMMKYSIENGLNALKASTIISEAAGMEGMIGGQIVDILSEDKDSISEEELRFMHACKTGELIRASIVAGAVLGEASNQDIEKLDLFGRKLGLAFQIKDDILDIIGDVKKLGKNIQKDASENKCNFITVYGLEKCKKMCEDLSNECIEILDSIDKDTKELKEIIIKLLNREK